MKKIRSIESKIFNYLYKMYVLDCFEELSIGKGKLLDVLDSMC